MKYVFKKLMQNVVGDITVIDVPELPIEGIEQDKIYRVMETSELYTLWLHELYGMTGDYLKMMAERGMQSEVHVVDSLPEVLEESTDTFAHIYIVSSDGHIYMSQGGTTADATTMFPWHGIIHDPAEATESGMYTLMGYPQNTTVYGVPNTNDDKKLFEYDTEWKEKKPVVEPLTVEFNNTTYWAANDGIDGYSSVKVNVTPNLEELNVTENGTYTSSQADGYSSVNVNITPKLQEKSITENGVVVPDDGYDGLSKVTVNYDMGLYEYMDEGLRNFYNYGVINRIQYADHEEVNFSVSDGSITSLTIPEGVGISNYNLTNCSNLKTLIVNGSLAYGGWALRGCNSLQTLITTGPIKRLGELFGTISFEGGVAVSQAVSHNSYKTFYIPESLRSVTCSSASYHGFESCNMLTDVTLTDAGSIAESLFRGCKNLESVVIHGSPTHIGMRAFSGCQKLKYIILPDTITEIGTNSYEGNGFNGYGDVFNGCKSLVSIVIPDSVTHIYGNNTFSNCDKLVNVKLPDNIQTGTVDFRNCPKLTHIIIPPNMTVYRTVSGGDGSVQSAFDNCTNLKDIYVSWSEDDDKVKSAPWGAENATVHYNWVFE